MQPDNPFAAPASLVADPSGSTGTVSAAVVDVLRRTKGWVRFLGVLGFIGAGLSLLMGLLFAGLGVVGASAFSQVQAPMPVSPGTIFFAYALLLCGASLLYVFPSWRLLKYGNAIASLEVARDGATLEKALEQQRAFWKMVGVIAVVSILLYGLLFVGGIGAAVLAGLRSMA